MRAVVAREQDERPVGDFQLLGLAHDPADQFVHVGHHVFEIALAILALARLAVRRRLERAVNEDHRIVDEEQLVTIRRYEVGNVPRDNLRAVFVFAELAVLSVDMQQRLPEARAELIDLP